MDSLLFYYKTLLYPVYANIPIPLGPFLRVVFAESILERGGKVSLWDQKQACYERGSPKLRDL